MPLKKGSSSETIQANIAEMIAAGRPAKQAEAAAYRQAAQDAVFDMEPEDREKFRSLMEEFIDEEMAEAAHDAAEWKEELHPRADNGQFGSGSGGTSPKAAPAGGEKEQAGGGEAAKAASAAHAEKQQAAAVSSAESKLHSMGAQSIDTSSYKNTKMVSARGVGQWVTEPGDDPEDNDFQVPSEETAKKFDAMAAALSKEYGVKVDWQAGEKKWVSFHITKGSGEGAAAAPTAPATPPQKPQEQAPAATTPPPGSGYEMTKVIGKNGFNYSKTQNGVSTYHKGLQTLQHNANTGEWSLSAPGAEPQKGNGPESLKEHFKGKKPAAPAAQKPAAPPPQKPAAPAAPAQQPKQGLPQVKEGKFEGKPMPNYRTQKDASKTQGMEVLGMENMSVDKTREYTPSELDWEYNTEYGKYSKSFAPNAFKDREEFQKKYDATPLTHMSGTDIAKLNNTMGLHEMATANYTKAQKLAYAQKLMGHRRDVGRIANDLMNGKTAPPIILKKNSQTRLMAGNTRLMVAAALGLNIPVKVIDVSDTDGYMPVKQGAKDQWFCFDSAFDEPLGPFPTKELAVKVASFIPVKLPPAMALDASVRSYDLDGRLKVANAHISKAMVSPYLGKEIPGCNDLGLDPERIYQLLRDPKELQQGAKTFNEIPILIQHEETSAEDHKKDLVVGTTGSQAAFDGTYLNNSLSVWDGEAIKLIEDEEQKELSCGYRYRPDMTPGVFQGQKYDGVMRDIIGNHVALVKKGRAGPDVVVGDSAQLVEEKEKQMAKVKVTLPSRTALQVAGALAAVIGPRLAKDAKLDLSKVVAGVNRKNFCGNAETKKRIIKMARDAVPPEMLTPEANKAGGVGPDDVIMRVLDMVDKQVSEAPAMEAQVDEMPMAAPAPGATDPSAAAAPMPVPGEGEDEDEEADKKKAARDAMKAAMLEKGLSEDDADAIMAMGEDPAAEDEDNLPKPGGKDNMIDKKAMDAALFAHGEKVKAEVAATMRATQEAREFVRPWVGDVSMALDSAEAVYRHALGAHKVDHAAVKEVPALRAMIGLLPKPGARSAAVESTTIAMDSERASTLAERFPHAARIGGVN